MADEPVILQFTQTDRDMLRDVHRDVQTILAGGLTHSREDDERFAEHDKRLEKLEQWQTGIAAIVAFVAFLLGLAVKFPWHVVSNTP